MPNDFADISATAAAALTTLAAAIPATVVRIDECTDKVKTAYQQVASTLGPISDTIITMLAQAERAKNTANEKIVTLTPSIEASASQILFIIGNNTRGGGN